jgi:F-type H+-transporting ATPase subunit beta
MESRPQEEWREQSHANRGTVVAVRGSVVDVAFAHHLPALHTMLQASNDIRILIEVIAHLNVHTVRGIALTPTQGLSRGTRSSIRPTRCVFRSASES